MIRRTNLQRLAAARSWGPSELSSHIGGRYSYWSDMLRDGSHKSFGERAARNIEERLDLPRGWLDQEGAGLTLAEPGARYTVPRWLFSADLYAALATAPAETLRQCEAVLRALLRMPAV